jgi:type II secretory pathway pseudopilin PulG
MVVVLLVGALLAIVVPRFYRQATNTVDGARLVGNFQYMAQAIGNYATDYYSEKTFVSSVHSTEKRLSKI